jgi:hypothetical protein
MLEYCRATTGQLLLFSQRSGRPHACVHCLLRLMFQRRSNSAKAALTWAVLQWCNYSYPQSVRQCQLLEAVKYIFPTYPRQRLAYRGSRSSFVLCMVCITEIGPFIVVRLRNAYVITVLLQSFDSSSIDDAETCARRGIAHVYHTVLSADTAHVAR